MLAFSLLLGLLLALSGPPDTASADPSCPCTVFTADPGPAAVMSSSRSPIEVGMKFRSSRPGRITSVRFWKAGKENGGQHVGSLWNGRGKNLATVTFTGESDRGWQRADFDRPVSIEADTTYVVSYYAPQGRVTVQDDFFRGREVVNPPLTAPRDSEVGGQGVYRSVPLGLTFLDRFPDRSRDERNYYVDVVFALDGPTDAVPPTVLERSPAPGATGVPVTTVISARLSEDLAGGAVTVRLTRDGVLVAATVGYDAATDLVTLRPTAALAAGATYTVAVSDARDLAGNLLTPVSWSFTTAAASTCPCTLFGTRAPVDSDTSKIAAPDDSATELGVRFRPTIDGYVTGVRFYKGPGNDGVHTGSLWVGAGQDLGVRRATATFTAETGSGWQTATFAEPVWVGAGETYVASYFAPKGHYSFSYDAFAGTNLVNGPLTALAEGANGVYTYSGSQFPELSYRQTNYWVDVVFDPDAVDTVAPSVLGRVPAPGATGADVRAPVRAVFSEPVSGVTVDLRTAQGGVAVAGAQSVGDARTTIFTPSAALAYSTAYTVRVSGGTDRRGLVMAPVSWTFTTGGPPPPSPDQGPGGPIAVITAKSKPYAGFVTEILRTEGLNAFTTVDVAAVSAEALKAYDTVILGAGVPLSAAQVTAVTTWVQGGGNLIALRPDAALSSLLGLSAAGSPLSEGYLKVNPATAPGAGIVSDTIQYHGAADRYAVTAGAGTEVVADLYRDATTRDGAPALTLRTVGSQGGQAAAFSYDLAASIALTRQGNPAWAGTERDTLNPIRSDDLFFGGTGAPDWVNLDKVAIPQADEQQRLLANLIQVVNRDRKPLPRFWYFPNSAKAVVVATGDDHANNGTAGRFRQFDANSAKGCVVAAWSCYRYSSYLWNGTPLSNTDAKAFQDQGFEVALHGNTSVGNYTPASIRAVYDEQVATFAREYPSLSRPATTRLHAIVFSDWSSQPKAEVANGIRMDTNYYYWPESWVKDRPGFMTGSGMAMRFTDVDGTMIDNYQAATQMTDESGQTYPYTLQVLLDNALGAKGFYGSFVANFHTDVATEPASDALLKVAKELGVPIVSARQLLDWLDARNASSFRDLTWSGNTLTFGVSAAGGSTGLTAMLPTSGPGGTRLTTLSQGGKPVSFTRTTVKGQEYAVFTASSAGYTATYGTGGALRISASGTSDPATAKPVPAATTKPAAGANRLGRLPQATGTVPERRTRDQAATFGWRTSIPAGTRVLIGSSPQRLQVRADQAQSTTEHQLSVTGLRPATRYYYRVASATGDGRTVYQPALDQPPATLRTEAADAAAPSVTEAELIGLPDGSAKLSWTTDEATGAAVQVRAPDGRRTELPVSPRLSRSHSFVLDKLDPESVYQVAISSRDASGNTGTSRPYRLEIPAVGVAQQSAPAFRTGTLTGSAQITDGNVISLAGSALLLRSGSFTSAVLDARQFVDWDQAQLSASASTGSSRLPASVRLQVRTGSSADPDDWGRWRSVDPDQGRIGGSSRYLQYRISMTALPLTASPSISAAAFTHGGVPLADEHEGE